MSNHKTLCKVTRYSFKAIENTKTFLYIFTGIIFLVVSKNFIVTNTEKFLAILSKDMHTNSTPETLAYIILGMGILLFATIILYLPMIIYQAKNKFCDQTPINKKEMYEFQKNNANNIVYLLLIAETAIMLINPITILISHAIIVVLINIIICISLWIPETAPFANDTVVSFMMVHIAIFILSIYIFEIAVLECSLITLLTT
jgi:hypothetical protein